MARMDPMKWDWTKVVVDHTHLRVADLAASRSFYETVLEPLEIPLLIDDGETAQFPNFGLSADGTASSGAHVAFVASQREMVDAFHAAGLSAGYRDNGAPGVRSYGPPIMEYYSAYLLDPDGNNVEAVHRSY